MDEEEEEEEERIKGKLNDKEMEKIMFPLYIFGSREGEGNGKEKKEENVYLLFVWFAKEEKYVFFYFKPH